MRGGLSYKIFLVASIGYLLFSQVGKREEDIQAKVQLMYEKER